MHFNVIDTGKGLSEDEIRRLKTSSVANREIRADSSSLGFSIIKDIIFLLGSDLYYETKEGRGSKFSFKLKKVKKVSANNQETIDVILTNQSRASKFSSDSVKTKLQMFYPFAEIKSRIKNLKSDRLINNDTPINGDIFNKHKDLDQEPSEEADYYLLVDDEKVTRKSSLRILNRYINEISTSVSRKKIILEASDGIECLNSYYQCIKKGIKLSCIISDESMGFMNGSTCAKILQELTKSKGLPHVPFFILSAYENFEIVTDISVDRTFTKPLSMKNIVDIFSMLHI